MAGTQIKRIAHLSVHGYFDPVPILGQTDTGGQVTYVLELAKHLGRMGIQVDIFTRQFEGRERIAPVNDSVRVVRLLYTGRRTGGDLRAGDDAIDARFFAIDELPVVDHDGKLAGIEILKASKKIDINTILSYTLELNKDILKQHIA